MTKREAAIVGAYTGVLLGTFSDMHEYIEEIMKRPVWPHEMANEKIAEEIKQKSEQDFVSINIEKEDT